MALRLPIRRHHISFKHAWDGVVHTIRTQPNFRVHLSAATFAVILGVWLKISEIEWVVIVFTILWVLVSEMINTSIEAMVDLLTHEIREEARIAKDVAAGMVLVGAAGAVAVGCIIFLPKMIGV